MSSINFNYIPQYGFGDWLQSDKSKWMGFIPGANVIRGVGRGINTLSEAKKDGGVQADDLFSAGVQMSGIPILSQANDRWIRENAGTIGKVGGAVGGAAIGTLAGNPMAGAQIGMQLGGAAGGAAQGIYESEIAGNEQAELIEQQKADIQRQMNYNNALMNFQNKSQIANQNAMGTQNFEYGGALFNPTPDGMYACGGSLKKMQNGGLLDGYTGQDHSGPQGGVPVDANGSPVVISNQEPVGLVKGGEDSWKDPETGEVYIFSDDVTL